MWILLAFVSAFLLGCYDVNKKISLNGNAVIPVLFFNTLISSLIFVPFIVLSYSGQALEGTLFEVPRAEWSVHLAVFVKALIVLSSWISGYFAVKYLPLTITGPVKATQPVLALTGALLLFGERLNLCQWIGVAFAMVSFYLLSTAGRKEGIRFGRDRSVFLMVLSTLLGAVSGLYDKYLMQTMDVMTVQVWFNVYQCIVMSLIVYFCWRPQRTNSTPFKWRWSIVLISVFLTLADWIYFYALSFPDAMISIVSMVRRSSVLITFIAGAILFREKNLKAKALDLLLVLTGMLFLYWGSVR